MGLKLKSELAKPAPPMPHASAVPVGTVMLSRTGDVWMSVRNWIDKSPRWVNLTTGFLGDVDGFLSACVQVDKDVELSFTVEV